MNTCVQEKPQSMFREFKGVRQEPNGRRRWFEASEIEFVVWYDRAGVQTGFQLIYWLPDGERALTWLRGFGFRHSRVDSGEDEPLRNMTPILIADGAVSWPRIEDLFRQNAASLDPDLRELVLARLAERR